MSVAVHWSLVCTLVAVVAASASDRLPLFCRRHVLASSVFPLTMPDRIIDPGRLALDVLKRGVYSADGRSDEHLVICSTCLETARIILGELHPSVLEPTTATRRFWKLGVRGEAREFWVDAVHFITRASRDTAFTGDMDQRLRRLRASCEASELSPLHIPSDHGVTASTDLTSYVLLRLMNLIRLVLWSTSTPIWRTTRFSTTGGWPENFGDIVPRGDSTTFRALLAHWVRVDDPLVDQIFCAWVNMCKDRFVEDFVQHRRVLVSTLLRRMHIHSERITPVDSLESTVLHHIQLEMDVWTLDAVTGPHHKNSNAIYQIFSGHEHPLHYALKKVDSSARILSVTHPAGPNSRLLDSVRRVGACLAIVFGWELAPDSAFKPQALALVDRRINGDAFKSAFLALDELRHVKRCDGPECTRYGAADGSVPATLQKCARCRFFGYCSKECQRAHWTAAVRPHKSTCPAFVSFQQRVGPLNGSMPLDEFAAKCRVARVKVEELVELVYIVTKVYMRDYKQETPEEEVREMQCESLLSSTVLSSYFEPDSPCEPYQNARNLNPNQEKTPVSPFFILPTRSDVL